ncbi:MAG: polymer-forming cytoskeletal protein [Proteobacteria bacterium]|nr:polymer-forming cytoskeletal protein [Pseudomonadota bacterium]
MFRSRTRYDNNTGVTIISKGSTFSGILFCRGISRIGGKIDGEIAAEGTLIIEKDAEILGNVKADTLIVQGVIKGQVSVTKKTEMTESSRLDGELSTPALIVAEGAILNSHLSMKQEVGLKTDNTQATDDSKPDAPVKLIVRSAKNKASRHNVAK